MTNKDIGGRTKEFQDFFTPDDLAASVCDAAIRHINATHARTGKPVTVLEPAVGSGALIWPLLAQATPVEVTCLDIQQWCIDAVIEKAGALGYAVELRNGCIIVRNYAT